MKTAAQHNAPLTGELHLPPESPTPTQTMPAPPKFPGTFPLVLYFRTATDRDAFIELVLQAKPDLVARPL